jgi:lipoprotein-anchoring transpeptidase ErfK/SrfK
MNPETIKPKIRNIKIYIVLLALLFAGITGYLTYSSQASKSLAVSSLTTLKTSQQKLTSLNPKYSEEITKLNANFDKSLSTTFLPWSLNNINQEIQNQDTTTIKNYTTELTSVQLEFSNSLGAWKSGIESDKEFVGKATILEELGVLNRQVSTIQNSKDLEVRKQSFDQIQSKYKSQLDLYNKKSLIEGIKTSQGDIDSMIEYFKKYPSLSASLNDLIKYKAEIETLSNEENLKSTPLTDLESKLNNQLRPLLSNAITAKNQNEERIRIAQQNQNQAQSDAPIKSGKVLVVNKTKQRMFVYENGVLIKQSPVTTGRNNWPTDPGTYSILTKERNRRLQGSGQGATWNVFVKYWMLFNAAEEEGMHDASWRNGNFGGPDYVTNGSRGCVNMPEEFMVWLFGWVNIGTPVVIQD